MSSLGSAKSKKCLHSSTIEISYVQNNLIRILLTQKSRDCKFYLPDIVGPTQQNFTIFMSKSASTCARDRVKDRWQKRHTVMQNVVISCHATVVHVHAVILVGIVCSTTF